MSLTAYIDDSLSDGEVLVLAGYAFQPTRLQQFERDWIEILEMRPTWKFAKMSDIAMSNDEVRWERTGWLYSVAERNASAMFALALPVDVLGALFEKYELPQPARNLYHWGMHALVSCTAQFQHELGN